MTDIIIHVDDIGTEFELTIKDSAGVVVDISTATEIIIYFKKPNKERVSKTGTLLTDGLDGKVIYISVLDDLDQAGLWWVQALVKFPNDKQYFSTLDSFDVHATIATP